MRKSIFLLLAIPYMLVACSLGASNPNYGTTMNLEVINGPGSGYTDLESGVAIKKILGNNQNTAYVLNSMGHIWQYNNGESWTNLNTESGIAANTNFIDFYYSHNYIFTVANTSPNSFFVYNTESNTWKQLGGITNITNNLSNLTIISGNDTLAESQQQINLLIGFNYTNGLPPQIANCAYNTESNLIVSCESFTFNNQNGTIKTISSYNNVAYTAIDHNIYTSNLANFQQWSQIGQNNASSVVQIIPNLLTQSSQYIATVAGLESVSGNNSNLYNTIPAIRDGLNSNIMAYDSALSLWVATTNNSALYVINRYNHLTVYSLVITNGATTAPFTSLYINPPVPKNQIYVGTLAGVVLKNLTVLDNN